MKSARLDVPRELLALLLSVRQQQYYLNVVFAMPVFLPRDAMLARYMLWPCVRLSVRVCLSLSVTSQCSTKTVKHRITEIKPHDSPGNLVFWCPDDKTFLKRACSRSRDPF